jgi:hypothetical protein
MDECKPKPSGPTCEYAERAVKSLEEKITLRADLTDKTVQETVRQFEHRLENMNRKDDELRKQAATFATGIEVDLKLAAVQDRLSRMERVPDLSSQVKVLWGALLSLIVAIIGLSGVAFFR